MQSTDAISLRSSTNPCGEGRSPERQVATGVTTVPIGEGPGDPDVEMGRSCVAPVAARRPGAIVDDAFTNVGLAHSSHDQHGARSTVIPSTGRRRRFGALERGQRRNDGGA